jgi:hypothetical protein
MYNLKISIKKTIIMVFKDHCFITIIIDIDNETVLEQTSHFIYIVTTNFSLFSDN